MSRAVIAVMAGLLCALAGVKHGASLNADAHRLARWCQLLRHLTLLLQEGALSIPEALCAATDGPHPPDKLLRQLAMTLRSSPMMTLAEAYHACASDCPERELLARMFTRIGQGSKESRVLALEQAAKEMQLQAESASVKVEKDVKLWQTLGFTGGICLTILLL